MSLVQTFNIDPAGNSQVTVAAGSAVIGHVITDTGSTTVVTGTVTANATLSAEKTKVIGTVNLSAAQTLATVTTVGAVTGITNALPAGSNVIGHVIVDSGSVSTSPTTSATGTQANVSGSASSVTLLASNASRKGYSIYNDSTAILRVAFSATASATAFSILLQPNSYYENNLLYTGIITGIWASAAGAARVCEFT